MASILFWDVDTQRDFMLPDGKLYVPGAVEIIPNLKTLTDYAHDRGILILASADDHVPGDRELSDTPDFRSTFPLHCLRATPGQRKIPETALRDPLVVEPDPFDPEGVRRRLRRHAGDLLVLKHWFDVFSNPNVAPLVEELAPEKVILYGVALDVCNRYAIEGLLERFPQIRLHAVVDAMKPIDPVRAEELLEDWLRRGVVLVNTDEVVSGRVC